MKIPLQPGGIATPCPAHQRAVARLTGFKRRVRNVRRLQLVFEIYERDSSSTCTTPIPNPRRNQGSPLDGYFRSVAAIARAPVVFISAWAPHRQISFARPGSRRWLPPWACLPHGGQDVALVVAHVQALLWGQSQTGGGLQQRGGVGLGMRRRVAAHRLAAGEQRHGLGQRVEKRLCLLVTTPGGRGRAGAGSGLPRRGRPGSWAKNSSLKAEKSGCSGAYRRRIPAFPGLQRLPWGGSAPGAGRAGRGRFASCLQQRPGRGAVDQGAVQVEQHGTDVGKHVLRRCGGWPGGNSRWCPR
jgi:hypothetical protein